MIAYQKHLYLFVNTCTSSILETITRYIYGIGPFTVASLPTDGSSLVKYLLATDTFMS
jgi:hypothetical protein